MLRCTYRAMKSYDDAEAMGSLHAELCSIEGVHPSGVANRVFYFAIPPDVFLQTAVCVNLFYFHAYFRAALGLRGSIKLPQ